MYRQFFNFKKKPFHKNIPLSQIFVSQQLKEFNARFEFLKQHRGLMLLTGKSSSGKTTSARYVLESLNLNAYQIVYIQLSTVTPIDFYRQINHKLGGEPIFRKCDIFEAIQSRIIELANKKNIMPIIVLDEAQFLSNNIFFELQLLLNFNMDSIDPAIFILVGQPHLYSRLSRPVFETLFNRINIFFQFEFLNKDETTKYIEHHLNIGGVKEMIFNLNALKTIFNVSQGNMRIINRVAFESILFAAKTKTNPITEEIIFKVTNTHL